MRAFRTILAAAVFATAGQAVASEYFYRGKQSTFTAEEHYGAPSVQAVSAPPGGIYVGEDASFAFSASGGVAPYAWSVSGGPAGLTVSSAGTLSGRPAAAGNYATTVQATDARGSKSTSSRTIAVAAQLTATTPGASALAVEVAKPMSLQLASAGGFGTATWAVSGLPAWASATASGAITGTPPSVVSVPVTATATDAQGRTAASSFTITAANPMVATAPAASAATVDVGAALNLQLASAGGSGTVTWTFAGLPAWATGSASGLVSGTATVAATSTVTATAKDSLNRTASVSFPLVANSNNAAFLVAFGVGNVGTSVDGTTWTARTLPAGSWYDGDKGNGMYVTVGLSGVAAWSTDAVTWTAASTGVAQDLYGVTYGNGTWVAVGSAGRVLRSTNGKTWTASTVGTGAYYGVAFGNGRFVMASRSGSLTSTDGQTWTNNTGIPSGDGASYANGRWFIANTNVNAYGSGGLMSSSDLTNWTNHSTGYVGPYPSYKGFQAVAFGGGKYIAVGGAGTLNRSTDGVAFTGFAAEANDSYGYRAVAYLNGKYYIGGEGTRMFSSPDGVTWTKLTHPITGGYVRRIIGAL